jgi:multimeric flavodoxin WrbA
MKVLAIMGSYRKDRTIDTLIDKSIEGAKSNSNIQLNKLILVDKTIQYCKNCMECRNDDPEKRIAKCIISDDMKDLYPMIDDADAYIWGTPINIGAATAIMKTFLERICWVFAKPGKYPIKGCPTPRTIRKKRAIIIVSSGIIPSLFKMWCDDATSLIKSVCIYNLNANVLGTLYAGAVENKGIDAYLDKAYILGEKLTSQFGK